MREQFAHVLWLGGASEAGKTTIALLLSERHGWQRYLCDYHEHNHFVARADPVRHPEMTRWIGASLDARWVEPTPEELFANVLASNDERFPMILDDLRGMPARPPILVEGPRLFPALVAPLLTDARQAVWLVPTEAFAATSLARRDKPGGRHLSRDPERFRENFLRRESLLRAHIRGEIAAYDLTLIEVDGSQTIEEVAARVDVHFAAYLASLHIA